MSQTFQNSWESDTVKRRIVWMAATLMVALCSLDAMAAKETPTQLAQKKGYVLLRIAMNSAVVSRQARDFDHAFLKPPTDKPRNSNVVMLERLPGSDRTLVVGAWAAPGNYQLWTANAVGYAGIQVVQFQILAPKHFEPFEVRAGELTYLDTVVFQPLGSAEAMLVRVGSGIDGRTLLQRHVPEVASALAVRPPLTWQASKNWSIQPETVFGGTANWFSDMRSSKYDSKTAATPIERLRSIETESDMLAVMKKQPAKLLGAFIASDGTAYYGSSLGQIWKRDSSATWRTLDTGVMCDITAVAIEGDRLYAATEMGTLLASSDSGVTFKEIAQSPNAFAIQRLDRLKDGGWVVSTQRLEINGGDSRDRREFYVVDDLAQLSSAKVSLALAEDFDIDSSRMFYHEHPISAGTTPIGFAAFEPPAKMHLMDAQSRTWRVAPPIPKRSDRMYFARDGAVIFPDTLGIKSLDGGQSWAKIDGSKLARFHVAFYDPMTGLQIDAVPTDLDASDALYTQNGGTKWTRMMKLSFFCPAFGVNEVLSQVYCLIGNGLILSSSKGDVWTPETIAP